MAIHIHYPGESVRLKFISSQLELFRFIPISVSEPMRIIPKQSEKRFVSRLIKNGQKSIQLNTINSADINLKKSEPIRNQVFQSRSIRINRSSNWSKPNFQSEWIRMNPRLEWFGLILIDSDSFRLMSPELIVLSWIDYWPFFIKRDTKRFLDCFGMIRIGSDTDIGINRNISDWLGMNFNPILLPG